MKVKKHFIIQKNYKMWLSNYSIRSELGQGGMAKVYLAHDKKFDSNVAIKFLNKEFIHNENIRKRFLAEARNMFRMSHPNIIKVTDLIEEGDTVAFVMEYVDGETLKEYLERKGKLSDEEIKTIFSQMLDAVGYVHKQGLIHRDIKPSNFMISPNGQVKLLDFGIAKNLNSNNAEYTITEQHQIMGTAMYMSPEQIKSTKEVTFSADIYSLGVVLWQMLAGKKPYNTNELSVPEIQVSIIREPLPLINQLWDIIIKKATAKEASYRFLSCEFFLNEILHFNISNDNKTNNNGRYIYSYKDLKNNFFTNSEDSKNTKNDKTVIEENNKTIINDNIKIEQSNYENKILSLAKKHLYEKDKVYFDSNIPADKKNNFHSRVFAELNKFTNLKYLIYCDDTLFGSGDDGWAIISTENDKCIFVIAEYLTPFMIYTLNFNNKNYFDKFQVAISRGS